MRRLSCECGVKFKFNPKKEISLNNGLRFVPCPGCKNLVEIKDNPER